MSKKLKFIAFVLFAAIAVSMIGLTACEGTAGKDGAAGKDGKSAYDIWLEQGNTGTEQDFLDSLKGSDGGRGLEGAPGENGKDGNKWFTGAGCPDEIDVVPLTSGSKAGDFYLCTECGALWQKRSDSFWGEIANLKGPKGDKGDAGEVEDDSFKLNVAAGGKETMPIELTAGIYDVEVALDQKVLGGKLAASVESSSAEFSSAFVFSQERTDAAANDTFVYYSYVIVEEGDTEITFAPSSDFQLWDRSTTIIDAKVTVKGEWQPQTLKADGELVEILLNSSNATADNVLKVDLDESVGEGSYKITVNRGLQLDSGDTLGVFDQTDNMGYGGQLVYLMGNETVKDITISASKNYLVFKPLIDLPQYHYLVPATVSLAKA